MRNDADRRRGSLVTQALGDALGFLVEGHAPELCAGYTEHVFRSAELPAFVNRTFGQYSDDTQLARELARSFVECGDWQPEDYARRVAELFATDRIVGRGQATEAAARRLIAGAAWQDAGEPSPSAGNGAAMRAGPVGLFAAEPEKRRRIADEQARVTHLDARSRAAAVLVAEVVADALEQPDPSLPVGSSAWCETLARCVEAADADLAQGLRAMPRWLAAPPERAAAEIAKAGAAPSGSAHRFEEWHGISPFATPSALYAVYAYALSPDDPERVLRTAVSVGGDVDTVAAMAGAMVGARVGWSALSPRLQRWAEALHDQGEWRLAELARLAEQCDDGCRFDPARSIPELLASVHFALYSFHNDKDPPLAVSRPGWLTEREPWRSRLLAQELATEIPTFVLDGIGRTLTPRPQPKLEPFDTWTETCGPIICDVSWWTGMNAMTSTQLSGAFKVARVARERGGWRVVQLVA